MIKTVKLSSILFLIILLSCQNKSSVSTHQLTTKASISPIETQEINLYVQQSSIQCIFEIDSHHKGLTSQCPEEFSAFTSSENIEAISGDLQLSLQSIIPLVSQIQNLSWIDEITFIVDHSRNQEIFLIRYKNDQVQDLSIAIQIHYDSQGKIIREPIRVNCIGGCDLVNESCTEVFNPSNGTIACGCEGEACEMHIYNDNY
ncbi:MAG: hypothetical protein AAFW00_18520 [Bacteroidota bacterium]